MIFGKKIPRGLAPGGVMWYHIHATIQDTRFLCFIIAGTPGIVKGCFFVEKNIKKRNWAFVFYPDSAPSDWRDILSSSGVACAVSPLHDKDINPDGTVKKAHYHCLLVYAGPTTYKSVCSFVARMGSQGPQPLESVRGYYRYLTHQDNPEKAQYSPSDVQHFGGFVLSDFVELSKREVAELIRQIQGFCRDNGIVEYSVLLDCLADAPDLFEWYQVAVTHTLVLNTYLTSRRHLTSAGPAVPGGRGPLEGKPDRA